MHGYFGHNLWEDQGPLKVRLIHSEIVSREILSGEILSGEIMSGEIMSGEIMSAGVLVRCCRPLIGGSFRE